MIVGVITGLLLLAPAPNDGAQQAGAKPAQQGAMNKYFVCMADAAKGIDDGRSDATTIATAIQGYCKDDLADYMAASRVADPTTAQYADSGAEEAIAKDIALKAVLAERHRATQNSN